MDSVGSRLARLRNRPDAGSESAATRHSRAPTQGGLSERLERMRAAHRPQRTKVRLADSELAARLGGTVIEEGLIGFRETISDESWSRVESEQSWAWWGHAGEPLQPLFLDTETTGLSGGTGTLAFLLGIVTQDEGRLELTQWLLTRFGAEAAMLRKLRSLCDLRSIVVTYNGKSFDGPLLSTRQRLHGMSDSLNRLPHLDMLHPIRRLWGRRWQNCRLSTAEAQLVGVSRQDDLSGAEAPAAWLSWVRDGNFSQLRGVLDHNRQDLLSLAALPRAVWRAVRNPNPRMIDVEALAREHEQRGEPGVAHRLLCAHEQFLGNNALMRLARSYRREGQWREALDLWHRLAGDDLVPAIIEIAKYQEHVARDLSAALEWTRRAIVLEGSQGHHCHRERRLLRKRKARP